MTRTSAQNDDDYQFPGFVAPQYTGVPDIVFDELMARLSGAELKVLMYIIRRTFGFKKNADAISYSQMLHGIRTRDGVQLDLGTGINSKTTLSKSLKRLAELNIIVIQKNASEENGYETTTYHLNMGPGNVKEGEKGAISTPGPENEQGSPPPGTKNEQAPTPKSGQAAGPLSEPAPVQKMDIQETAQQKTVKQKTDVVVVDLIRLGVNRRIAARLADAHSAAYIREKIDYLEFTLHEKGEEIGNPVGWLLKAIETDYSRPAGYLSPEERVAAAARLADIAASRQAVQAERETDAQRRLAALYAVYQTTEDEKLLWEDVLDGLKYSLYADGFRHLDGSRLLKCRDGECVVWIEDGRSRDIAAAQLTAPIRRELGRCGVGELDRLTLVEDRELLEAAVET